MLIAFKLPRQPAPFAIGNCGAVNIGGFLARKLFGLSYFQSLKTILRFSSCFFTHGYKITKLIVKFVENIFPKSLVNSISSIIFALSIQFLK